MKIKLNYGIKFDVALVSGCAKKINDNYIEPDLRGISGLKTLKKYKKQEKSIKNLFKLYKSLLEKDVKDFNDMVDYYIDTDKKIAQKPNMCTIKPIPSLGSKTTLGDSLFEKTVKSGRR